ncbi:MAG: hypothetical protein KKC68_02000, partial [Candidatus Thermoplasmatota archaeon]|nr:hypothetical protein [Candidatus Thermoplasmatota archaeon]
MSNSIHTKGYCISILILLILGSTIPPLHVQATNHQPRIQITFPGIHGTHPQTITLTTTQQTSLTQIITDVQQQMAHTTTPQQTFTIIINTLNQLNQAHIITTTQHHNTIQTLKNYQKLITQTTPQQQTYPQSPLNTTNYLCFIVGETTNSKLLTLEEL